MLIQMRALTAHSIRNCRRDQFISPHYTGEQSRYADLTNGCRTHTDFHSLNSNGTSVDVAPTHKVGF